MKPHSSNASKAALTGWQGIREIVSKYDAAHPGWRAWVLCQPLEPERQIMINAAGAQSLDILLGGPVAQIPFPPMESDSHPPSDWRRLLLGLLIYQFPWLKTTMGLERVWTRGKMLAVVGVDQEGGGEADRTGEPLAGFMASCLQQWAETAYLGQDILACRHLLNHHGHALLLTEEDGVIRAATPAGWEKLDLVRYGGRRRNLTRPDLRLPESILVGLRQGAAEISLPHGIKAAIARFPAIPSPLIDPLVLVEITGQTEQVAVITELQVGTLTPTQREVYSLLIGGFRNKEIAQRLSISIHTARHHVSAVLAKLRCADRLQLLARASLQGLRPKAMSTEPAVLTPAPLKAFTVSGSTIRNPWLDPAPISSS